MDIDSFGRDWRYAMTIRWTAVPLLTLELKTSFKLNHV